MVKMNFDNLPIWDESSRYAGSIKWKDTPGSVVPFELDGTTGEFEIISYNSEIREITFLYLGKPYKMKSKHFKDGHIADVVRNYSSDFKIEIGTVFEDYNRNIIILDRKKETRISKDKKRTDKLYRYRCNKCGYDCGAAIDRKTRQYISDYWTEESNLLRGKSGCACCSVPAHVVVPHINSVVVTNPEVVSFFEGGESEAEKYTFCSEDRIATVCPDCGRKRLNDISVKDLVKNHSINCPCSDKISYPEKVMYFLLEQLNIDFVFQLTHSRMKWCGEYKYDFFFEMDGEKYIIETHGLQHYEGQKRGRSLKREQENDINKKKRALANGIKTQNYIVIDCRISQLPFIRKSIETSELNRIFNLSKIDWENIQINACSSLVKKACDIKRENPMYLTSEIGKIMRLHKGTISRYLKVGTQYGWCDYNPEIEKKRGNEHSSGMNKKNLSYSVEVISAGGESRGVYDSARILEKISVDLFGVSMKFPGIQKACRSGKQYKGFYFKYSNNN